MLDTVALDEIYEKISSLECDENCRDSVLQERIDHLEERLATEIQLRRKYQHELLDMKGDIRIFCRINPIQDKENALIMKESSSSVVVTEMTESFLGHRASTKCVSFDRVFDRENDREIYNELELLVQDFLSGNSVTILAYGPTGSGKTYTMLSETNGVIFKAIDTIFTPGNAFHCKVEEVYCDKARITFSRELHNAQIAQETIREVAKERKSSATALNVNSSRSHIIFTFRSPIASLTLVDLAGSERVKDSKVENEAFKEATAINQDLLCLHEVFTAIREKRRPIYRQSALTQILQTSLTGKALLIVHVRPDCVKESMTSLRWGNVKCTSRKALKT